MPNSIRVHLEPLPVGYALEVLGPHIVPGSEDTLCTDVRVWPQGGQSVEGTVCHQGSLGFGITTSSVHS